VLLTKKQKEGIKNNKNGKKESSKEEKKII